jgi:hypothetical protein
MLDVMSVYLGDRLGLYRVLRDGGPATAPELATRAGIDERYAREWLEQQAATGILVVDDVASLADRRRYVLPDAYVIVDFDIVVGSETDTSDWIKYGDGRPNGFNLRGADGERWRLVVVNTGASSGIVAIVGSKPADFDKNTAALDRLLATLEFR